MDRKLADILEKQADLTKQPFIQNDITERLLEKTGGEGLYTKFTIDLSVAHTDEKYNFHGDRLTVENVDDAVTIKLNSRKNDPIDLQKIPELKAPIKCFFVTNDAGSGELKLLCGSKGMFEAKKKPEFLAGSKYIIYLDGTVYKAYNVASENVDSSNTNPSTVIQYALDNTTSGKVTVNCDITQTVALTAVDDIILDFTNHLVTLSGNANFLTMTQKSHFILENVRLTVPDSYTGNIIELNASTGTCRYNKFNNILVDNVNSATQHGYTGIQLNITSTGNIFWNNFRDMWFRGVDTGIDFNLDHTDSWANGNFFENIFIDRYVEMVDFDIIGGAANGANNNIFINVSGQTYSYSTDGFKDVRNTANHFENCTVFDWASASSGNHTWSIHADATNTYIMTNDSPSDMTDGGTNTFIGHYANNLELSHINQNLNRDLFLFQATSGNPYFYIYGDDSGSPKYVKMRITSLGHFRMQHHQGGGIFDLWDDGKVNISPGGSEHVALTGTKTTTGDPTGREGLIYINTFDNKLRMYCDGAWRDLATW